MKPCRWIFGLLLLTLAAFGQTGHLRFGMTAAEVEAVLGKPTSAMAGNDRAIWFYPDGGRVELARDRVVTIRNLPVEGVVGAIAELADSSIETPPEAAPGSARSLGAAPEMEAMIEEQGDLDLASATQVMGKFEQPYTATVEAYRGERPSGGRIWGSIGLSSLFQLVVILVVLRGAFAWSDLPADWSQLLIPALVDMATRTAVVVFAELVWHTSQVFYLDYGLSYFALLFTLMKTTAANNLQKAVAVTVVAKGASIVVWSLLSVVLLQLAFG